MSEEVAFLEALKANPADDTARLVYADWLDEHDEPAKAEYLRLVARLARAEQDYAREQPDVSRVLALAEHVPPEWRNAAGARFSLIFYSHGDMAQKIYAIKVIRGLTGQGLAEAKAMSEQPPSKVFACVPFEVALDGREQFAQIPSTVVRIHPSDITELPFAVRYSIVVMRSVWGLGSARETAEEVNISQFARFLRTAMGLTAEAASQLASEADRVTVAENLDATTALARMTELQKFHPLRDDQAGWLIHVMSYAAGVERREAQ